MKDYLLVATIILAFLALVASAMGAPPPGTDLNSPTHKWFEAQHSVTGAWCCDLSDGHVLEDTEWRQGSVGYEVKISGIWQRVPDTAARDPHGGPNPTGKAIVWYTNGDRK